MAEPEGEAPRDTEHQLHDEEHGQQETPPVGKRSLGGRPQSFVWSFYTKTSDHLSSSKRYEVACNACKATFLSRVEQMEAHLANNCQLCSSEVRQLMRSRIAEKAEKKALKDKEASVGPSEGQKAVTADVVPLIGFQTALGSPLPDAKRSRTKGPSVIPLHLRFPQVKLASFF